MSTNLGFEALNQLRELGPWITVSWITVSQVTTRNTYL